MCKSNERILQEHLNAYTRDLFFLKLKVNCKCIFCGQST